MPPPNSAGIGIIATRPILRGRTGRWLCRYPIRIPDRCCLWSAGSARRRRFSNPAACAKSFAPSLMLSGFAMDDRRAAATPARLIASAVAGLLFLSGSALADTSCRSGEGFKNWLGKLRQEAAELGMSERTLASLDGLTFDDRVFKQ